ncbi:hypothetical protein LJY25_20670 [Hymenobacter sp. BT175]|uniref:hypothetical protein n=1 Tax=Hymenobacter translucens TaxID=2886507 RepID=UPI001D0E3943|nr:hypothetical protein [Hymenobacter translucens]MCC2548875.1 hypothetical protein [Hymenobacter translucens]
MKFRTLLLLAPLSAALLSHTASAQDSPERRKRYFNSQGRPYHRGPVYLTAGGGVGLYRGDLTSSPANNFIGPAFSGGVLYLLRPHLVLGAEGSYFVLGAKDDAAERSYAFRGTNGSVVTFLRYELLRDESEFATPRSGATLVKPYVMIGGGILLYNPRAYVGTERPDDQTQFLGTERNDYSATGFVAPVGGGVVFRLTRKFNATVEGAYYLTTTDHLDDISQRGNPSRNDGYGLLQIKGEYSLGK